LSSFKEGMIDNRKRGAKWRTTVYYASYLVLRLTVSIMIGFTSFVSAETNVTFWCILLVLSFLNFVPFFVFEKMLDNFSHLTTNLMIFWVTLVFTLMTSQSDPSIS